MIRQRKRPNAKEAKTLKVMSEFKRSGLGSWKTSGDRYGSANAAATDYPDKEVMQALVTVGALVALADGHLEDVERDELVGFVHRQDFAPTTSQRGIAKAFDGRVRQLEENYSPDLIMEALRPLADLSLTSVVVRTAERVAVADRKIHPSEQQAINLIRLIMLSLPANKPLRRVPLPDTYLDAPDTQ